MIGALLIEVATSQLARARHSASRAWRRAASDERRQLGYLVTWAVALILVTAAFGDAGAIAVPADAELGVSSDLPGASIQAGGAASPDH